MNKPSFHSLRDKNNDKTDLKPTELQEISLRLSEQGRSGSNIREEADKKAP